MKKSSFIFKLKHLFQFVIEKKMWQKKLVKNTNIVQALNSSTRMSGRSSRAPKKKEKSIEN